MNRSITKKIDARLANEGKTDKQTAIRKGGDHEKMKMKVKKVSQYKGNPPKGMKRFVNNALIPPRMKASMVDNMKFRQEIPQDIGVRPLPKDKQAKPHKELDNEKFVRVGNNLYRNEESVLDQAERMTHSVLMRRELSKNLNGVKFGNDKEIANKLRIAHVAEKKVIAENEKEFLSRFTGPTKTLVEIPELKQELDEKQNIKRQVFGPDQKSNEAMKSIAKKIGFEGFLPNPREQARIQREKN